jgi:hypothetical protein
MRTRPVWRGLKRSQSARRHLMSADPVTYPATLRVPVGMLWQVAWMLSIMLVLMTIQVLPANPANT